MRRVGDPIRFAPGTSVVAFECPLAFKLLCQDIADAALLLSVT